jgi:D-beta-D-heptose 7-phosphate kinase/D-beta-D-heptose 1-phosphate adenosyltransferase
MNLSKFKKAISDFKNKKILVIGDLILDHYVQGEVSRISPEAPVPVVWARGEKYLSGGVGNVGNNIIDLGANVSLCGVLGKDHYGESLFSILKKKGIDTDLIIQDPNRPTTLKSRIMAQHQQIVRLDWESNEEISLDTCNQILQKLDKDLDRFDGIIIEDYGKGVINPHLVSKLVTWAKAKGKIITVDPKEEHFDYYREVTALTPNLKEAQVAAGLKVKKDSEIDLLGSILMDKLKPQALLVTLGEQGMKLFTSKNKGHYIPTAALEVFDVTGAGDTVIAVFTLGLVSGLSFLEATQLANFAAGLVVEKLGAATVSPSDLVAAISKDKSRKC